MILTNNLSKVITSFLRHVFRNVHSLVKPFQWLSWALIHKYSGEIFVANEFHGLEFECPGPLNRKYAFPKPLSIYRPLSLLLWRHTMHVYRLRCAKFLFGNKKKWKLKKNVS